MCCHINKYISVFLKINKKNKKDYLMKAFFKPDPLIFYSTVNSKKYPVNTIQSVESAFKEGADVICLNIALSGDGAIMCVTDSDIGKFCEKSGKVSDYTLAEIKELDAGYSFKDSKGEYSFKGKKSRFFTLEEVFQAFPDKRFNITIMEKNKRIVESYASLVKQYNFTGRVLTSSLHGENIKLVRSLLPESATAFTLAGIIGVYALFKSGLLFLKKRFKADALQTPEAIGVSYIANSGLIEQMHKKGIKVHVWDIKGEAQLKRVFDAGADGFMVEDIQMMKKFLSENNK